jgi:hypothetical protein
MKISIEHFKDNTDGSTTVIVDTDAEANEFLLRYGIVAALEDAIAKSKSEYTPEEKPAERVRIEHMKAELSSMKELLATYDEELRIANEELGKKHLEPLSEERIFALYRHSMDWRIFARDIEREHGIGVKELEVVDDADWTDE